MDSIRITGIEVFGYHGVLSEEKATGQTFVIDLTLHLDLSSASATDDLSDTVDYGVLAKKTHDLVARERFDLIETVADGIAAMILEEERIESVVVAVHKPGAPIAVPFEDVVVTVRRP